MNHRTQIGIATALVLLAAGCTLQPAGGEIAASEQPLTIKPPLLPTSGGTFSVHALGKMCLDFGGQAYWAAGAPVTLYWCNGSIAQIFDVQEVAGAGHDVTLHIGTGTDNNYCIGARGGSAVAGAALEMQVCNGSDAQQFALDGDSIIAGHRPGIIRSFSVITAPAQPIARELVARPLNDVTSAKTPIVLGPRQLTEDEYFTFVTTDGSSRKPHSGFVTPPATGGDLQTALNNASWGSVIEVPDATIDMTGLLSTPIKNGVTLRGDRRITGYGPLIEYKNNDEGVVFDIAAHDVRVTGLRFQGPAWGTDVAVELSGLRVHDAAATVTIDHDELLQFTSSAVDIRGVDGGGHDACNGVSPVAPPRPTPIRISGNFIHHNVAVNEGYGVGVFEGGFPLVERNVAYQNRHTIAANYDALDGYVATDNYVLHQGPDYGTDHTANFDVHGSLKENCHKWWGGIAGDYVVIQYNTFLSDDRENVSIRGQSCRMGLVDGNVFARGQSFTDIIYPNLSGDLCHSAHGGAVVVMATDGTPTSTPPELTVTANNAYDQPAPVNDVAVGDFNGDGVDDIFTTTGTGWFYSSGGKGEWRWLRRASDLVAALRLGDLDGDGRTDVIRTNGSELQVSWGGVSGWRTLTQSPAALPIGNYAIGNFDGDRLHGDDIFVTDGARWYVAKNGHNFALTQTSSAPASTLRFGDFDGDGKTDVFTSNGGHWAYSSAAVGSWVTLAGAPTATDNLVAGDFDGDGRTDIGRYYVSFDTEPTWKFAYSPRASAPFGAERVTDSPAAWSGRFADGAGVIWWDADDEFTRGPGTAPSAKLSRQKMK